MRNEALFARCSGCKRCQSPFLGYVPKTETAIVKAFIGTVPELTVIDGEIRGARLRMAA